MNYVGQMPIMKLDIPKGSSTSKVGLPRNPYCLQRSFKFFTSSSSSFWIRSVCCCRSQQNLYLHVGFHIISTCSIMISTYLKSSITAVSFHFDNCLIQFHFFLLQVTQHSTFRTDGEKSDEFIQEIFIGHHSIKST